MLTTPHCTAVLAAMIAAGMATAAMAQATAPTAPPGGGGDGDTAICRAWTHSRPRPGNAACSTGPDKPKRHDGARNDERHDGFGNDGPGDDGWDEAARYDGGTDN